jgi:hypothetical protein
MRYLTDVSAVLSVTVRGVGIATVATTAATERQQEYRYQND